MACEDDNFSSLNRNETYLTNNDDFGKTWQIVDIEIDLGVLVPHSCVSDNNFTYYPDGRYEVNEGVSKCNPNDPPAWVGTWFLNENQNTMTIVLGDSIRTWDVESIGESTHRLSSFFNNDLRIYTFTAN